MYKYLKIENFRGFKKLEIDNLKQISLFVGKNNCGKTTIIESLFLITGPTNPSLPIRISEIRGLSPMDLSSWTTIFYNLDIKLCINISAELTKPYEKRVLKIKPNIETFTYTTNSKNKKDDALDFDKSYSVTTPTFDSLILEYNYKQAGKKRAKKVTSRLIKREPDVIGQQKEKYKDYLIGAYISSNMKLADIDSRFHSLLMKKRTDEIVEILKQMEPSFKSLDIGRDRVLYCDIGLERRLPINIMGDGFITVLSAVMNIMDMENGMVFFDEIESGLHHSWQDILWEAIFKTAKKYNVQVFASTHSMECVKAFANASMEYKDLAQLFRIDKFDNKFKVINYSVKSLLSALESGWEVR